MRALPLPLVVAVVALLAGCADPALPSPPEPPALHTTDCVAAPNGDTCTAPTARTPLALDTAGQGNRSRVGIVATNHGTEPLRFDGAEPPAWFYVRDDAGDWRKVAVVAATPGEPVELAPGAEGTFVFHYGKATNASRANSVYHEEPFASEPWPSETYRVCLGAHPFRDGAWAEGWVRGCKDFRIR